MSKKKLKHEQYGIGWICPLEVEQTAALAMLDEVHERLTQPATDHNVYTLGSINNHNVVIAGQPQTGNNAAAKVVTQMRMTFPNLRFGLLVGIGGGVPVKTDAGMIRLGDVVVSKPEGSHSGAVQYDHGKAEVGRFTRTGILAPPPAVLLNAAQDVAAKQAMLGVDYVADNIERIDTGARGLRRYRYPGRENDYLHLSMTTQGSSDDSDVDMDADEISVRVHRGTIASGEMVIKDAQMRDQLAAESNVLCFEMEAAGVLSDFPCLVIRGISDYCDSRKNDKWHGFAAAAAAAYTRQLFFHLPINDLQGQDEDSREEILNWITSMNYGTQQSRVLGQRQEGTGQWFLDAPEFAQWVNGDRQTLFCPGIPGAGKTTLTSIIIEHLDRNVVMDGGEIGLAYIYFDYQQQDEQTPLSLLSSLLKQLLRRRVPLSNSVKNLYQHHKERDSRPILSEIVKVQQSVIDEYSKVFIIVDALDECGNKGRARERFLHELFNLQKASNINFLATSRHNEQIARFFERSQRLEIQAANDDVQRYIRSCLYSPVSELPTFISERDDVKEEIETAIIGAVKGLFLLASLHLDSIIRAISLKELRTTLNELPSGLDAYDYVYQKVMARIQNQPTPHRNLAHRVLGWVTFSLRPLSTIELQHILAVEEDQFDLDKDNLPDVRTLCSVCAGLVTIDEQNGRIRLVHYTAQEYLKHTHELWFPNIQRDITMTCLTYLSFDIFNAGFCQDLNSLLESYPAYKYAALNWGHHALAASIDGDKPVLDFLQSENKVAAACQVMLEAYGPTNMNGVHLAAYFGLPNAMAALRDEGYFMDLPDSGGATPLTWASKQGHRDIVKLLLEAEVDPDFADIDGQTPLSWAAENGHHGVVELLLKRRGVNPNSKDRLWGHTPLLWALQNGRDQVVRLLLANDRVDPNLPNDDEQTPLGLALDNRDEASIRQLIAKKNFKPNQAHKDQKEPFWWALENRNTLLIELLLARDDVDPNRIDRGRTPLMWALTTNQEQTARILLASNKVDPNLPNSDGLTALWWSIQYDDVPLFDTLMARDYLDVNAKSGVGDTPLIWLLKREYESRASLQHGLHLIRSLLARPELETYAVDKAGETALFAAIKSGHDVFVRVLFEHGIDIDQRDSAFETPLTLAAKLGNENIVRALLDDDAPLNDQNANGETALYLAAASGSESIVKLLLEKRAFADAPDAQGNTALSVAVKNYHEGVAKLLLTEGANPNLPNNILGETPLHLAATLGSETMVVTLLKYGARPNAIIGTWHTPLYLAASHHFLAGVHALLAAGADPNLGDIREETPLFKAAESGDLAIVKLLLERGADPNWKDGSGQTPIFRAVSEPHGVAVIELLVDKGADIEIKDKYGRTALFVAVLSGCRDAVRTLLEKGAKTTVEDHSGRTPLSLGNLYYRPEVTDLLRDQRAGKLQVDG